MKCEVFRSKKMLEEFPRHLISDFSFLRFSDFLCAGVLGSVPGSGPGSMGVGSGLFSNSCCLSRVAFN